MTCKHVTGKKREKDDEFLLLKAMHMCTINFIMQSGCELQTIIYMYLIADKISLGIKIKGFVRKYRQGYSCTNLIY